MGTSPIPNHGKREVGVPGVWMGGRVKGWEGGRRDGRGKTDAERRWDFKRM